jgi:hypothetical protein
MKKIFLCTILVIFTVSVFGQDITGKWNGLLSTNGVELRVDFNITKADEGYTATLDSPDQDAYGIPVNTIEFTKPDIKITITDLTVVYEGKLESDELIKGTFTQMGQSFPMDLKKAKKE